MIVKPCVIAVVFGLSSIGVFAESAYDQCSSYARTKQYPTCEDYVACHSSYSWFNKGDVLSCATMTGNSAAKNKCNRNLEYCKGSKCGYYKTLGVVKCD